MHTKLAFLISMFALIRKGICHLHKCYGGRERNIGWKRGGMERERGGEIGGGEVGGK